MVSAIGIITGMRILYLASLREAFGMPDEEFRLPLEVRDVGGLLDCLRARGGIWSAELEVGRAFRVAVNHELATVSKPVGPDDEIALLPPVTGG